MCADEEDSKSFRVVRVRVIELAADLDSLGDGVVVRLCRR